LIATIFCYLIFLVKDGMIKKQIDVQVSKLQIQGTISQKDQEKQVIGYQNKINDFSNLLKNHEFASNAFAFLQAQTMPNVWFKQYSLDEKGNGVQLSGEADSLDALSRQVAAFEKNEYVKSVGTLNSSLGESARAEFNLNLVLDQKVFGYLSNNTLSSAAVVAALVPPEQTPVQQIPATPINNVVTTPPANTTPANNTAGSPSVAQPQAPKSSAKLLISFHLLLTPEVVGLVDQSKYTVTLNVPYNTDVKNLIPAIIISPGAMVMPNSDVSQDFTGPVTYRVTAEDGSVQGYQVKVIVATPAPVSKKTIPTGSSVLTIIMLVGIAIVIITAALLLVLKKMQNNKVKL